MKTSTVVIIIFLFLLLAGGGVGFYLWKKKKLKETDKKEEKKNNNNNNITPTPRDNGIKKIQEDLNKILPSLVPPVKFKNPKTGKEEELRILVVDGIYGPRTEAAMKHIKKLRDGGALPEKLTVTEGNTLKTKNMSTLADGISNVLSNLNPFNLVDNVNRSIVKEVIKRK